MWMLRREFQMDRYQNLLSKLYITAIGRPSNKHWLVAVSWWFCMSCKGAEACHGLLKPVDLTSYHTTVEQCCLYSMQAVKARPCTVFNLYSSIKVVTCYMLLYKTLPHT